MPKENEGYDIISLERLYIAASNQNFLPHLVLLISFLEKKPYQSFRIGDMEIK